MGLFTTRQLLGYTEQKVKFRALFLELFINGEIFWVDRVSPDDGGSCYLWLNRGQPPAVNRRR